MLYVYAFYICFYKCIYIYIYIIFVMFRPAKSVPQVTVTVSLPVLSGRNLLAPPITIPSPESASNLERRPERPRSEQSTHRSLQNTIYPTSNIFVENTPNPPNFHTETLGLICSLQQLFPPSSGHLNIQIKSLHRSLLLSLRPRSFLFP